MTEPIAGLAGVSKSFGSLRAVDDVWFDVAPGEVHALFGENGAGKTTAMKILAGLMQPDVGQVMLRGRSERLRSRKDAARAGIGFVQQHFSLVDELTCAENLLLGQPMGGFLIDRRSAASRLRELSEQFQLHVRPDTPAGELSMGERQRLEILIALSWGTSVLILDEPTAALGVAEFDALRQIVSDLKDDGVAIIFITHKVPELLAVADRVTVMRQGRVVWQGRVADTDPEDLVIAMVGELPPKLHAARDARAERAEPVVRLVEVSTEPRAGAQRLRGISLEVFHREIVGVAGVAGNGQRELALVLAGAWPPDEGRIEPDDVEAAYIPEDRALDALALDLPSARNAIVRSHPRLASSFLRRLAPSDINRFARTIMSSFDVRPADPHARTALLSGGNQQKLVLGRELAESPRLIVAHNPARGLDLRTALDVRRRLLEARDAGAGIALITPDLDELLTLSDRVVVLYEGALVGELARGEITASNLGRLMSGMG